MKCMHCGIDLSEDCGKCTSCGKAPSVPDGFVPDAGTGLYTLTVNSSDPQTGIPITVVTSFNPDDGSYSQETFPAATEQKPEPEPDVTPTPEPEPAPEPIPAPEVIPAAMPESAPVPSPEPEPMPQPEKQQKPKKKRHIGAFVAVFIILLLAGGFGAAYYYGFIMHPAEIIAATEIQNITEPPADAAIPVFLPVEPPESLPDELAVTPADKNSLEIPEPPEVQEAQPPVVPVNYYPALANVSLFHSRAMQDESYIYYLPPGVGYKLTEPADLMRVSIGSGKPEYIASFWPNTGSVYSFTLYESDIIVCARKPDSPAYGFYRAPKSGGDASFLFEQDSPSLVTVYSGKLFMLFPSSKRVGIFDLKNDSLPAFIDLTIDDGTELLPAFSVNDGYLYYGISRGGGERVDYMRRSLFTGETIPILSSSGLNELWMVNPVWDDAGNAYYGQFNSRTNIYSFKSCALGGAPESLFSFPVADGLIPFSGAFGYDGILAMTQTDNLRKYRLDGFSAERDIKLDGRPYAVTNDYLVAQNGLYLITDFSWIPLEAPVPLS